MTDIPHDPGLHDDPADSPWEMETPADPPTGWQVVRRYLEDAYGDDAPVVEMLARLQHQHEQARAALESIAQAGTTEWSAPEARAALARLDEQEQP